MPRLRRAARASTQITRRARCGAQVPISNIDFTIRRLALCPARSAGRRGRSVRRLAVGLLTACVLAAPVAPAAAEGVDGATYQRLVALAASDPAALSRLRGVTAVDGRPVDMQRLLAGSPARVDARLRALRPGQGHAGDAAAARRSAAAILAGADYRRKRPGLFARALSWLARLLSIPAGADGVVGLIVLAYVNVAGWVWTLALAAALAVPPSELAIPEEVAEADKRQRLR